MSDLVERKRLSVRRAGPARRRKLLRPPGVPRTNHERPDQLRTRNHAIRDNSLTIVLFTLFVVLSVFLRQQDSAESKPVESSDETTGEANK